MRRMQRQLVPQIAPHLPVVLAFVAGVMAWLPLLLVGRNPTTAETRPRIDQRAELQLSSDIAGDGRSGPVQQSAPFFTPLCATDAGLWTQTVTAGMTGHLEAVELLLLRRSSDIASPVEVEIRAVDEAGLPTDTLLGRGSTSEVIPSHRSTPSWLTVPLDEGVRLQTRQRVAIVPRSAPAPTGACYEWVSSGLDQYRGGGIVVTHDLGRTYTPGNGSDAAFRTWMR